MPRNSVELPVLASTFVVFIKEIAGGVASRVLILRVSRASVGVRLLPFVCVSVFRRLVAAVLDARVRRNDL